MDKALEFGWVDFYKEFAQKLLAYKDNRAALIEKVKKVYENIGINLPTLEKDNNIIDIDPFTVIGLFNKSSLTTANRIKIMAEIARQFQVAASFPTTEYTVPTLNNQNATFYDFIGGREEHDIDDLWNLFETALAYAAEPSQSNRIAVSDNFDLCINKKGNGNSKITMGLYWIAPNIFLNLDSRNTWFIYDSGKLPASLVKTLPPVEPKIPADKYFDIVEKVKAYLETDASPFKDYIELSAEAWRYSEEVNENQRAEQKAQESRSAEIEDDDANAVHYWIYSPGDNACIWDECYNEGIIAIGWDQIGDLRGYQSKEDMKQAMKDYIDAKYTYKNSAHATWQFANEMKPGDVVFVKKGMHTIIGRGVVESEYIFDATRSQYKNIRKINWTNRGTWEHPGQAVMKTLTDITAYTDYVEQLESLFRNEIIDEEEETAKDFKPYSPDDFLKDVFMDPARYAELVSLLNLKQNVILQGAPGVGKTYAAKRLAYSIMGVQDTDRVMMVQFHQSYSYEDFIMGYRPAGKEFVLKEGAFYKFCKKAAEDDNKNHYYFIIDEINRGNLSKIFGELFMLIESDKRDKPLRLLYNDEMFSVPSNVYIIGMMNTADRSLAMLDYALRRRFAFFELKPGFETEGFRKYSEEVGNEKYDRLISCVKSLNTAIASDDSLGDGFCIGHSFFCFKDKMLITDQVLSNIVEYELIPLLKEYWFDEPTKVRDWSERLRSAVK